jgi:hypothetical protein
MRRHESEGRSSRIHLVATLLFVLGALAASRLEAQTPALAQPDGRAAAVLEVVPGATVPAFQSPPGVRRSVPSSFTVGRGGRYIQLDLVDTAVRLSGGGFSARLKARMAGRRFVELDPGVRLDSRSALAPVTLLDTSLRYETDALGGLAGSLRLDVRNVLGKTYVDTISLDPVARARDLSALARVGRSFSVSGGLSF